MYLLHWTQQSLLLALLTEWVLGDVAVTDTFPFPSIFTAYTVVLLVAAVLLFFMLLTKTPFCQLWASGKRTRPLWFPWHRLHLPYGRKPPQDSNSPAKALLTFFHAISIPRPVRKSIHDITHTGRIMLSRTAESPACPGRGSFCCTPRNAQCRSGHRFCTRRWSGFLNPNKRFPAHTSHLRKVPPMPG